MTAEFCPKPRGSSSSYIMGNSFSATVSTDLASSRNITSHQSGILFTTVKIPTFPSYPVDYSVQTREALFPAALEISSSLPSNPLPINEPSKCTVDCNAKDIEGILGRRNGVVNDVSRQWIQVGRASNIWQTDPESTEPERTEETKADSKSLLIDHPIWARPIEQAVTVTASSRILKRGVHEVKPQPTAVQASIEAESVASKGATTRELVDDDEYTLFTPVSDSSSQSTIHSAQDVHGEDINHQTPTIEKIAFKQQDKPSQVENANRLQTVTAQAPAQAKSPPAPPPSKPPMVYFIPHVSIQLFGRPHGHHVRELMH